MPDLDISLGFRTKKVTPFVGKMDAETKFCPSSKSIIDVTLLVFSIN